MRVTTLLFLCFTAADILTTIIGLRMGMQEMNIIQRNYGWGIYSIFRILSTILIVVVLQYKTPTKLDILVPLSLAFFVMLNAFQIAIAL